MSETKRSEFNFWATCGLAVRTGLKVTTQFLLLFLNSLYYLTSF